MEYEYVALSWGTYAFTADEAFGQDYDRLAANGWRELWRAPYEPNRIGGACIMRRPKSVRNPVDTAKVKEEARCEGRLWTEREIESLFESWYERLYAEDAQVYTKWLVGILEKHIAVLNKAIRKVMHAERYPDLDQGCLPHYEDIRRTIRVYLHPLMTPMPRKEA